MKTAISLLKQELDDRLESIQATKSKLASHLSLVAGIELHLQRHRAAATTAVEELVRLGVDVRLEAEDVAAPLNFSQALDALKGRQRVARQGWNGKGMWIDLIRPGERSDMTAPYLFIGYPAGHPAYPNGSRVPWLPSQTDILAEDWVLVDE